MKHVEATAVVLHMQAAAHDATFNAKVLVAGTGLTLRQVSSAIDFLRAGGLIESPRRCHWRLTEAGRAVSKENGVVRQRKVVPAVTTAGVSSAARSEGATGLRAAAWRALRIRRSATADELCSLVDDGSYGKNVRARILTYFGGLQRFGVIGSKKERKGAAERLYILLSDLGRLAPMLSSRGRAYDPNKGDFLVKPKQEAQA